MNVPSGSTLAHSPLVTVEEISLPVGPSTTVVARGSVPSPSGRRGRDAGFPARRPGIPTERVCGRVDVKSLWVAVAPVLSWLRLQTTEQELPQRGDTLDLPTGVRDKDPGVITLIFGRGCAKRSHLTWVCVRSHTDKRTKALNERVWYHTIVVRPLATNAPVCTNWAIEKSTASRSGKLPTLFRLIAIVRD